MERGPNIHYVQFSHSHAQGHTHHNGGGNPEEPVHREQRVKIHKARSRAKTHVDRSWSRSQGGSGTTT